MIDRQKLIMILIPVIFIAGFFVFKPNLWQSRIESYLNRQLDNGGWRIKINKFSGHLFSNIYTNDILLTNVDGTSVLLPKISAKIMIFPLIKGEIKLSTLSLNNASIFPFIDTVKEEKDDFKQLKLINFLVISFQIFILMIFY